MIRHSLVVALCLTLTINPQAPSANGQSTLKPFDISIAREHKPDVDESMNMGFRGGTYFASNVPLEVLLMNAYDIRPGHIVGLRGWQSTKRWDVQARWSDWNSTADTVIKDDDKKKVLQSLLTSLFSLKVHRETRLESGYELQVAPGGLRMHEHTEDHEGAESQSLHTWRFGVGTIDGVGIDTKALLFPLESKVERPVVDHTALSGFYDVHLRWAERPDSDTGVEAGLSLESALTEQLGLQLRKVKVQAEVLVVDDAARPENN